MDEQINIKLSKLDQKLIEGLYSSENDTVLANLDKIKSKGNTNLMPALIHVLSTTKDELVKEAITDIFCQLKDTPSIELMIIFLQIDKYSSIHNILMSAVWQTGFDGSKYLSLFIELALKGDYLVCLDVLSIIDNMRDSFQDDLIQDLVEEIERLIPKTEAKQSQLLFELIETVRAL